MPEVLPFIMIIDQSCNAYKGMWCIHKEITQALLRIHSIIWAKHGSLEGVSRSTIENKEMFKINNLNIRPDNTHMHVLLTSFN